MRNEYWVPIQGYEGYYEISNYRRVKSLPKPENSYQEVILKKWKNFGYVLVTLSKDGVSKKLRIHRVYAQHFIPNPENKPCINHKNGIKDDNSKPNLEWCTFSENSQHAIDTGLRISLKGEQVNRALLTNEQALEIFNSSDKPILICKKYNVSADCIRDIRRGTRWGFITGKKHIKMENRTILTEYIVESIYNDTLKNKDISKKYQVNQRTVYDIKNKRTWRLFTDQIDIKCGVLKK